MIEQFQIMSAAIEAGSSPVVAMWINWMGIMFIASVLFVWNHKGARLTLVTMILTLPVAAIVYNQSQSIHLIGVAHILLWTPLAWYMMAREMRGPNFNIRSPYGIWAALLTGTILVSLVFDVRDIFLVLTDQK